MYYILRATLPDLAAATSGLKPQEPTIEARSPTWKKQYINTLKNALTFLDLVSTALYISLAI
jgi:hypothetical protein